MNDLVSMPVWFLVLMCIFAVVGLTDRIFAPSVKWFFRRKANKAIEELNTRLRLRIQPFKTTRRQALIDRVLFDPEVIKAIEVEAQDTNTPRSVVQAKAERYAREIVPAFNAYAYSAIGTRAARWASTFVYRVRLGYANDESLAGIDPEATVVFVMNHRSNMDYVLVTYLASASATLSYAVGEWARIWLLQSIIRAMGAYFVRRDSGNLLHRRVLARYVAMATQSGVTQAIFPEGGLSRDGNLRDPKFGLLSYMVDGFNQETSRDIVFVPVGLNYDRVLEDRMLTSARDKKIGEKSFPVGIRQVLAFFGNMVSRRFKGQLYRLGYACASFGEPISLKSWLANEAKNLAGADDKKRFATIEELGTDLMQGVADVIPVLPVSLVATVFEDAGQETMTELEMKAKAVALMSELEASGAHIHLPRGDRDYAISTGLRMLTLRHLVREDAGVFQAVIGEEVILAYYANSIRHLRAQNS